MVYRCKWSLVSCRSSAGQGNFDVLPLCHACTMLWSDAAVRQTVMLHVQLWCRCCWRRCKTRHRRLSLLCVNFSTQSLFTSLTRRRWRSSCRSCSARSWTARLTRARWRRRLCATCMHSLTKRSVVTLSLYVVVILCVFCHVIPTLIAIGWMAAYHNLLFLEYSLPLPRCAVAASCLIKLLSFISRLLKQVVVLLSARLLK